MANEATLIFETALPIPFTVANETGIEKGTLLKMTDPMTAIAVAAAKDVVAGIAAEEKIASDGKTKLGVYRRGIFKVSLSGACTVGDPLVTSSTLNNIVTTNLSGTDSLSGAKIIGYALETGATGETILMELNIHASTAANI